MKKLLAVLALLALSTVSYAQDFSTNVNGITIKNVTCMAGMISFSLVNKSDKKVFGVTVHVYDSAGDPIDNQLGMALAEPNTGASSSILTRSCNYSSLRFTI